MPAPRLFAAALAVALLLTVAARRPRRLPAPLAYPAGQPMGRRFVLSEADFALAVAPAASEARH